MREVLKELVKNTIILEYELPHKEKGLEKTPLFLFLNSYQHILSTVL